jgi:hypothetical protein
VKLQKILTAGLAVVAALTFTAACSDNNDGATDTGTPTSSATSSAPAAGGSTSVTDPSTPPNAATLNGLLTTALDPNVPATQKTNLVQGSEADPQLFDKLVKAKQQLQGVDYQLVPPVISTGSGAATVKVKLKLPNQPEASLDAAIVYDKGRWKLAKTTVCPLLQGVNVTSPMCSASN